jgi:hypothetical protein
MCGGDG